MVWSTWGVENHLLLRTQSPFCYSNEWKRWSRCRWWTNPNWGQRHLSLRLPPPLQRKTAKIMAKVTACRLTSGHFRWKIYECVYVRYKNAITKITNITQIWINRFLVNFSAGTAHSPYQIYWFTFSKKMLKFALNQIWGILWKLYLIQKQMEEQLAQFTAKTAVLVSSVYLLHSMNTNSLN